MRVRGRIVSDMGDFAPTTASDSAEHDRYFRENMTRMLVRGWQKVNTWRFKGPLFVVAFLLGIFDHALHWGGASFAAAVAIIVPIIGFRAYWNTWKFWASLSAFILLQIPLVFALRSLMEKSGFPMLYAFGILDCAFVVTGFFYVLEA